MRSIPDLIATCSAPFSSAEEAIARTIKGFDTVSSAKGMRPDDKLLIDDLIIWRRRQRGALSLKSEAMDYG